MTSIQQTRLLAFFYFSFPSFMLWTFIHTDGFFSRSVYSEYFVVWPLQLFLTNSNDKLIFQFCLIPAYFCFIHLCTYAAPFSSSNLLSPSLLFSVCLFPLLLSLSVIHKIMFFVFVFSFLIFLPSFFRTKKSSLVSPCVLCATCF